MAAAREFSNYEELNEYLKRKEQALRSLDYIQSAYPLICKFLESQTKKAFHNQCSPGGQQWPSLANRRARGTTGHVLRDTGELMASVTASGTGHVRRLEGQNTIYFGTNLIKGFHNQGGMIQARRSKFLTIPATTEALYVGGMRNFPRKLNIIWDDAKGKGVAYERVKVQKKKRAPAGTGRKRRKKKSGWLKRMQARIKKIMNYFRKKTKKPKGTRAKKAKKSLRKQKETRIVVHYYLRKFVIVPQRKFLEVTQDTQEKVGKIVAQEAVRHQGNVT